MTDKEREDGLRYAAFTGIVEADVASYRSGRKSAEQAMEDIGELVDRLEAMMKASRKEA